MRYLRRSQQLLHAKDRSEVERQAERYFGALGYRRREDDPSGRLVFERGKPLASLYTFLLRSCRATVRIEVEPRRLVVHHEVEVIGRILAGGDAPILDAEARGFETFLDGDGVAWDRAVLERGHRRARRKRAARGLLLLAYTASWAVAVAWWVR
jgi:hypothetical protein